MSVRRQSLPRCTGVTNDGSQCGRRATDFTSPALCHIHRAKAQGQAVNPQTESVFDGLKELRRLTRSSDDRVRLRAVDLLIELERKAAEKRDRSASPAGFSGSAFIDVLTADERSRLRVLTDAFKRLQTDVYERHPQLRPAGWSAVAGVPDVAAPTEARDEEPQEVPSPVSCSTESDTALGPDEEYLDEM
jgi:hypothetical protein